MLTQDSNAIAGPGRRAKPITREVFDVLAGLASTRGHRYFAYINSDIVVLQDQTDEPLGPRPGDGKQRPEDE